MIPKKTVVTLAAIGGLVLVGCSSSDPSTADGKLDEVKYVKAVKAVAAKTHKETQQKAETERYCKAKKKNGTCKSYGTRKTGRTIPVSVVVTDKPAKPGKPALYCVELDDVNGDTKDDDQWFAVSWAVYSDHVNEAEGKEIFDMEYFRTLVACTR